MFLKRWQEPIAQQNYRGHSFEFMLSRDSRNLTHLSVSVNRVQTSFQQSTMSRSFSVPELIHSDGVG
jgi:hypothetical protein